MHDSGFYIQKIFTKREMVNCQKFDFDSFNNNFCHYRSVSFERDKRNIASYTYCKGRNARDLDEVSSDFAGMLNLMLKLQQKTF